jgi:hypothetical protein
VCDGGWRGEGRRYKVGFMAVRKGVNWELWQYIGMSDFQRISRTSSLR